MLTALRDGLSRRRTSEPIAPVASAAAVEETEALIKERLPSVLRRFYLEVANGGYLDRFCLLGVRGGQTDYPGRTVPDMASKQTRYRRSRVAFCYLGGAMYLAFDATKVDAPIEMWDEGEWIHYCDSMDLFFESLARGQSPAIWKRRSEP